MARSEMQSILFVKPRHVLKIPSYRWYDKIRWFAVKLLGGIDPNETAHIVRAPIDADADMFMDRLYKQKQALFDYFNGTAQELLIGADDYEELMCCIHIQDMFSFDATYNYDRQIICGLRVTVVPWMRGILVMP